MNQVLLNIFPELVANKVFWFTIHPVAELYIEEKQKEILREPIRVLNLYKERLRLLVARDNRLELCKVLNGNQLTNMEHRNGC